MKPNLLLVGCGKMGGAILQRVSAQANCCVVDPVISQAHLPSRSGIVWCASPDKIDPQFTPDIILIAIKPQHMAETLPAYRKFRASVFVSIAAGQPIARIETLLGDPGLAVVRAMPNLPASIGQGMAVAVANKNVVAEQRKLCDHLLRAIGVVAWVEDENLLDAVTALSGSGPAYIFALIEAMEKAGAALGLPKALAAQLARQTVIGSGALLAQSSESAGDLRAAVTSPGGTTEAALKCLLAEEGLSGLILKTMQAAAKRAKELS